MRTLVSLASSGCESRSLITLLAVSSSNISASPSSSLSLQWTSREVSEYDRFLISESSFTGVRDWRRGGGGGEGVLLVTAMAGGAGLGESGGTSIAPIALSERCIDMRFGCWGNTPISLGSWAGSSARELMLYIEPIFSKVFSKSEEKDSSS